VREDSLLSVRGLINAFNAHVLTVYSLGPVICVDESMESWLGDVGEPPRCRMIPRKPTSVGLEMRNVAVCATSILIQVESCAVKAAARRKMCNAERGNTLGSVLRVVQPWLRPGRTAVGGSHVGSPRSCVALRSNGLLSAMTMKRRRFWLVGTSVNTLSDLPIDIIMVYSRAICEPL
jgi:hypothetical protein